MFGCIYQLWDWLEAPPLFNAATMDAKKLQQLQQANAQKKLPLAYQTNIADYRTSTHSPVFHQQQQPPAGLSAYHMQQQLAYQQSPTATSSSGGPLTPIDMQPQANKLLLKHMSGGGGGGTTSSSSHSSPYHQSSYTSGEQLYQSPTDRTYLSTASRLQATSAHNPATALQQQYQQLQQAKLQAQMQTQNEALQQQQRTFAMRQAMNPPVPQGHFHMSQSSSIMSTATLQQQQQQQQQQAAATAAQHQRAPPSSLNLPNQFQPAAGPLKVSQKQQGQQQQHYHQQQQQQDQQVYAQQQLQLQLQLQHQQQLQQQHNHLQQHQQQQPRLKSELQTPGSEQSPVYIQQNHPGHVVNQACQTQISAVKGGTVVQKTTPSSEDSSSKSPSHAPLDRKKSVSSMQALKSPITKRPPASPVTLSGWLYKQGSDGLKVWRKRWFVLAEYCLYYYKGPEEEKLLGSILLPSYKVAACLPEDKIYRKYAFKCEHQNMRTYWLAAETGESMVQWVRALTAATMMQAPSSGESEQPSATSSLNHSGENSDSGIHTLQSQQSKMSLNQGQLTPASENGTTVVGQGNVNSGSSSNSGGGGGGQPLYANAPPKPRRINDGGYSSPSPEHSIDNERKQQQIPHQQQQHASRHSVLISPTLQQMQQQYQQQQQHHTQQPQQRAQQPQPHHAIYDARTGNVSSALRLQQAQQQYSVDQLEAQLQQHLNMVAAAGEDYGKSPPPGAHPNYMDIEEQIMRLQQQRAGEELYGDREMYIQKLMQQRYNAHLALYPNAERRTPDAYGRSKNRLFSDYEDIYNLAQCGGVPLSAQEALLQEAASYRRPLSPPSYDGTKHVPAMPSRYTPNHLEPSASNNNLRARPAAAIVRPHSADFLEYEARAESAAAAAATNVGNTLLNTSTIKPDAVRAPRPKSSLDINRTPDSFYYSEACYAEKMRKSALYLQNQPNGGTGSGPGPSSSAQPQQAGGYRTASDFLSPVGGGLHTIGFENAYERASKRHELMHDVQAAGAASMPRMSRSNTTTAMSTSGLAHHRSQSTHPQPQSQSQQHAQQLQSPQKPFYPPTMSTQQIIQQSEQFLRSASARLPKRNSGLDDDYNSATATSPAPTSALTATSALALSQQQQQQPPLQNTTTTATTAAAAPTPQDGERKREESMKRLLEWKQRMLQSPLTRKGVQQGGSNMSAMSKLGSNPNILLASTAVASGAHYATNNAGGNGNGNGSGVGGGSGSGVLGASAAVGGAGSGGAATPGVGIQRSRSDIHANLGPVGYASYSSDEEDGSNTNGRQAVRSTNSTTTSTKATTSTTTTSATTSTTNSHITLTATSKQATAFEAAIVAGADCKMQSVGHICNTTTEKSAIATLATPTSTPAEIETMTLTPTATEIATSTVTQTIRAQQLAATKRDVTDTAMHHVNNSVQSGMQQRKVATLPRTLKPILKGFDSSASKPPMQRAKLQLNMTALRGAEPSHNMSNAVPILPKKPAPKSPQITTYTPVYTTKTLTPSKTYENVQMKTANTEEAQATDISALEEKQENEDDMAHDNDVDTTPTEERNAAMLACVTFAATEGAQTAVPPQQETDASTFNAQDTPMLAQLKMYQKIQEAKQCTPQATMKNSATMEANAAATQIVAAAKNVAPDDANNDINEDDDDDETACEEYTDDDLDEALAEDADAENDSVANVSTEAQQEPPPQQPQISGSAPHTPTTAPPTLTLTSSTPIAASPHINPDENYYLPMTPKKIDLSQSGNLTLLSMHDSNTEEESPYIEMSKHIADDESKSNYEVMCIGPHSSALTSATPSKTEQLQIQAEPVYMELSAASASSAPAAAAAAHAASLQAEELHSSSGKSTLKKNKKASDTLKKKSKKSSAERAQNKRKDLPDILKPSQGTMTHVSDSSDADDESSKHIDLKKMRSRTRFSLSDTFRPASYYLGASTPLANCAESSDSEIVSPPPIPSSPPPMEELKTEEIFSSEHYDTVKRRDSTSGSATKFNLSYEQLPKLHASNTSLNQKAETSLKCSRLSLPDQFTKQRNSTQFKQTHSALLLKQHERTLSDSNYSFQTDNSSNTSSDFDFYNKLKQRSPSFVATPARFRSNSSLQQKYGLTGTPPTGDSSETDSVEFRHRQGSDSELERQRSRRPLSEESISEIESLREKFEETLTHDLDTYLSQLQSSDLYLYQNTVLDAAISGNGGSSTDLLTKLIKPPAIFRNKGDEHFYGNIRFVSSTDSLQQLGSEREREREVATGTIGAHCLTPTAAEQEQQLQFYTPMHSRNNSNISEQSAPYYYSELNSSREMLATPTSSTPLNNQREVHAHGSNITHIHNPIEGHTMNINMDLLADKDQAIDSKNLYKMKTNVEKLSYRSDKILKTGEVLSQVAASSVSSFQEPAASTMKLSNFQPTLNKDRNPSITNPNAPNVAPPMSIKPIPPQKPSQKYTAYGVTGAPTVGAVVGRTRNATISGVTGLDVAGGSTKNTNVQLQLADVVAHLGASASGGGSIETITTNTELTNTDNASKNVTKFSVLGDTVSGELLWEEDTLWRESLRRVSQRHARSLDDLDRIVASPQVVTRREPPTTRTPHKTKITRDVTYVNDNVSQQLRASYKPRLSDPAHEEMERQEASHEDAQAHLNENDVYVQLMAERLHYSMGATAHNDDGGSDVYEVLRADSGSNLSHKSAEIDRDAIRQWDSMSSGLMKNSGSNSNSENDQGGGSESLTSVGSAVRVIIDQLNNSGDSNDNNSINSAAGERR